MTTFTTTIDGASVDKLGVLLAQIADLTKQADKIKDQIKDGGVSVEGALFKAAYVECNRSVFDKVAFIKSFGQEAYDSFQKTTAVFSVKVTSR
jgi:hypothetical protein